MNGWNENYTNDRQNYHANLPVVLVIWYPYKRSRVINAAAKNSFSTTNVIYRADTQSYLDKKETDSYD